MLVYEGIKSSFIDDVDLGIIADKISVDVNIIDNDSIEISKAEVVLDDHAYISDTQKAVKSLFGDVKIQIKTVGE